MKATFYVANEEVEQVKSLVRKYSSLRFLSNPLKLWGKFEFRLEGDVQDFKEFFSESVFQKESGLTPLAPDACPVCELQGYPNGMVGCGNDACPSRAGKA